MNLDISRRHWLGIAAAGGITSAAGLSRAPLQTAAIRPAPESPAEALTLLEASPVFAALVARGGQLVAGGIFDLHTGRVGPVALG